MVKNVRQDELQSPSRMLVYVPFKQTRGRGDYDLHLVARTEDAVAPPASCRRCRRCGSLRRWRCATRPDARRRARP
jgi:hypothetical protein